MAEKLHGENGIFKKKFTLYPVKIIPE